MGCCLSFLWAWGTLSRHDILAEEYTEGWRWRVLYKLPSPMRWGIVEVSAWGSGNEPHSGKAESRDAKYLTFLRGVKMSMSKHHSFWFSLFLQQCFSTRKYPLYKTGAISLRLTWILCHHESTRWHCKPSFHKIRSQKVKSKKQIKCQRAAVLAQAEFMLDFFMTTINILESRTYRTTIRQMFLKKSHYRLHLNSNKT